ncbi:MAG: DUF547 domain-containing protein [Acidobacteria bacterium]|nr:DUF547 domain-containing protein [Acidobacteriota bacterium]
MAALAVVLADPAQFDAVLQKYVLQDGKVRYGALQADLAPLTAYVEAIGATNPDSLPSPHAKLAFWINTYNALVLHSMAAEYPESKGRLGGLLGRASYFYRRKFRAGGQMRSLADIENNTIRKFGEPRIHFAIVCASVGCPWLARRAFTAENLESLLEDRAKLYFSQSRSFRLEEPATVRLTAIFDWFRGDFPPGFVERYRPEAAGRKRRYLDWDWSLNDAP